MDGTLRPIRSCPRRRPMAWLAVLTLVLLAVPAVARAQFDTPNRAFHKATAFPLDGRHLTAPCESCHVDGVYKGTPTLCASCHWVRRQDDVYKTRLGIQCEQCHRTTSWSATSWDHAAATGMPLNAAHRAIGCDGCHKNATFTGASTQCITCHRTDFERTTTPNHLAAGFSTACESCHLPSDATFGRARFDHNATFPLVGVHAIQTCQSCHTGEKYQGTPRDCIGCHRVDFERTTSPNHVAAGFSTACETCHRPTDAAFRGVSFNHNEVFPLHGPHATADCASCHTGGRFAGTPRDCVGCHKADYDRTANPNHAAAGFSTACETCHKDTETAWRAASGAFDHDALYPLIGPHAFQNCEACHVGGRYAGTPTACVGCHRDDYDRTAAPSHVQAGFGTNCEDCHSASASSFGGRNGGFDHNSVFPLVGPHATQACATCHVNGVFRGTPRDCVGCHKADYDRTTAPSHAAAGFSTACEGCHNPAAASFGSGSFDHASVFPLVGRHNAQACTTCHTGGVYRGTPRDCIGCHRDDYDRTAAPSHAAAGFGTACEGCHNPAAASWGSGSFDHASIFPLNGQHATVACTTCHTGGRYAGTPRDCYGCHRADYEGARDPNHVATGFPTACETCHRDTDASWNQGRFTHTWFPVTSGKHSGNPCSACHTDPNNYATFTCLTCHGRTETDSHHRGRSGYRYESTACYACHPNGRAGVPVIQSHALAGRTR